MADLQRQQQAEAMIDKQVILVAGPGETTDTFIDAMLLARHDNDEIYGLFNGCLMRAGPGTTKEELLKIYWKKR